MQLLRLGRVWIVENFSQRAHRFIGRAFLNRQLRREQPPGRVDIVRIAHLAQRVVRARRFPERKRDRGFVLSIFGAERRQIFELFPKLERVRLARAGEKSRDRANSFRLGWAQLIRGARLLARFDPVFALYIRERFRRMPPRLESFDRVQHWPRAKESGHEQDEHDHTGNDEPAAFKSAQADLLRRHHEFVRACHRAQMLAAAASVSPAICF